MRIWGKYWGYLRGMGGKITYYTVGWEPPPRLRRYSPYPLSYGESVVQRVR